ncbi:hypothetical protein C357_08001 [Citreicella sp. 357]|nr:hypothetical protein C357_08001 [Citreicella sp. 357]
MQSICAEGVSFASVLRPSDRIAAGRGAPEPRTLLRRQMDEARAGLRPGAVLFAGPVHLDSVIDDLPARPHIESYGGDTRGNHAEIGGHLKPAPVPRPMRSQARGSAGGRLAGSGIHPERGATLQDAGAMTKDRGTPHMNGIK